MIEKEIRAVLVGEEDVNGIIHLEPLRGPQGYSAYELYVMNLPEGEEPLSEKEWLDSLSKANYYTQYTSSFNTIVENVSTFPIGIPEYNETCILELYVNGFRRKLGIDYTIDVNNNIVLTNPIAEIGTEIYIVVYKTIVATVEDYEKLKGATFIPNVDESGNISWTNDKGLDNPTTVNIKGPKGEDGIDGTNGKDGLGVPSGGLAGQVLAKKSEADNDTEWIDNNGKIDMPMVLNAVYPVGSIYISVDINNPSILFGGTWEQFAKGKTLIGVDDTDPDFNASEMTGGEKKHTLTVDEMPNHIHKVKDGVYNVDYGRPDGGGGKSTGIKAEGTSNGILSALAMGGDQPHNNLQPYITVYMWKRVA